MLRSVLIFVSPSSNSFPFVRAISRTVLNFQAATPAVPAFAKRPPQGLLCGDGSGAGANWRQREQLMSGDSAAPQFGHVIDEVVGVTRFHSIGAPIDIDRLGPPNTSFGCGITSGRTRTCRTLSRISGNRASA